MEQQVGLAIKVDQARRGIHLDWLREWGVRMKAAGRWVTTADGHFSAVLGFLLLFALTGRFWVPRLAWWWHTKLQRHRFGKGKAKSRDATLVYVRMLDYLRRQGYEKPTWVTPHEFAAMLQGTRYAAPVSEFAIQFVFFFPPAGALRAPPPSTSVKGDFSKVWPSLET